MDANDLFGKLFVFGILFIFNIFNFLYFALRLIYAPIKKHFRVIIEGYKIATQCQNPSLNINDFN